jgi:hypothetical protein
VYQITSAEVSTRFYKSPQLCNYALQKTQPNPLVP